MRAPKLIAVTCACTLALGGTASLVAADTALVRKDGFTAARPHAPAATPRPVEDATADPKPIEKASADGPAADGGTPGVAASEASAAAAAQQQPPSERKKGNAFLRALTAPFRGLARLFGEGGGNDGKRAARFSVEEKPRAEPSDATRAAEQSAATQADDAARPQTRPDAPRAGERSAQQLATVLPRPAPAPTPLLLAPAAASSSAPVNEAAPRPTARAGDEESYAPAPFMPLVVGVPGDALSQGRALLEHGYLNEAISVLSVASVNSENLVEANNLLGLAYDRRGWHAQAREAFERALAAAPQDPHVLSNLGYSLYLADRYKEALSRLKQAARRAPGNPHIANNLALVYGRLQKYGDAFKHFERAGGELYARLQTGALLEAARRDHEAIKHYEAARRLDPASTEALRRLVPLYNRTGQRDKAEAARVILDRPAAPGRATS